MKNVSLWIIIILATSLSSNTVLGFIGFCSDSTHYNNGLGFITSCDYGCNDTTGNCYKTPPYPTLPSVFTDSCEINDLSARMAFHFNNVAAFSESTSVAKDQSVYGQSATLTNAEYVSRGGANYGIRSTGAGALVVIPNSNSMYNTNNMKMCTDFYLESGSSLAFSYGSASLTLDGTYGNWEIQLSYPGITRQIGKAPSGFPDFRDQWNHICISFTPDFYNSVIYITTNSERTYPSSVYNLHSTYTAPDSTVTISTGAAGARVDELQLFDQQDKSSIGCPCIGTTCATACNGNNNEVKQCNNNVGTCDVLSTQMCDVDCVSCNNYCSNIFTSNTFGVCEIGDGLCHYTTNTCVAPSGCNGALNSTCHCIENWNATLTPASCALGTPVKTYTDLNHCGTTIDLPSDNGSTICCGWCQWQRTNTHSGWDDITFPTTKSLKRATNTMLEIPTTSIIAKGYVYNIGSGGDYTWLYQYNASDISQEIGKVQLGGGGAFASELYTPIYSDNYIYVKNGDGRIYKLSADDVTQILATSTDTFGNGYGGMVSYAGFIYMIDHTRQVLVKISGFDLSLVDSYPVSTSAYTFTPIATNGHIYINDYDYLREFNASNIGAGPINSWTPVGAETPRLSSNPVLFEDTGNYGGIYVSYGFGISQLDTGTLVERSATSTGNSTPMDMLIVPGNLVGESKPVIFYIIPHAHNETAGYGIYRVLVGDPSTTSEYDLIEDVEISNLMFANGSIYVTILCNNVGTKCTAADQQYILQLDGTHNWAHVGVGGGGGDE